MEPIIFSRLIGGSSFNSSLFDFLKYALWKKKLIVFLDKAKTFSILKIFVKPNNKMYIHRSVTFQIAQ